MSIPIKQHLIDPEICIRCYSCEAACTIDAITYDDTNVVVDAAKCNFCMSCIPVCPTGSIDEWRIVNEPYSIEEQFDFMELPEQKDITSEGEGVDTDLEAIDEVVAKMLAEAHSGAGGKAKAPLTASKPSINLYTPSHTAEATVQGNYKLTGKESDVDVRHIILNLNQLPFPFLEGQSVGIIVPGVDTDGQPHKPRLYSISNPRDGERPNFNNISLTVKREKKGICSNYICDLEKGDKVHLIGPFGATFLMPTDPSTKLLMICTGTGSAPFRGFTMQRLRNQPLHKNSMTLVFGARNPDELPYFGPLEKIPDTILNKIFAFSRKESEPKKYVQDTLREHSENIEKLLTGSDTYIYICGLRAMEQGVNEALSDISRTAGLDWGKIRDEMRESGRYHVETY